MAWFNPDVHSWSVAMSQTMREQSPEIINECKEIMSKPTNYVDSVCTQAKQELPIDTHPVIDKIICRRNMQDGDLCGVNPLAMFVLTWLETKRDPDSIRAVADILRDIGGTCLQGDTHRLYSLLLAFRRSYLAGL